MNFWGKILLGVVFLYMVSGCHSTKKLQTAVNKIDTVSINKEIPENSSNRLDTAREILTKLDSNEIDFKTFSAKAKVNYEDHNGKQPDFNTFIRIQKDSVLWVSISSTFLGIEAFRLLITPDTIIILNKLDKTVEYHPFSYVENVVHIPMNFSVLQNILIGNPVYVGDSVVSYVKTKNHILIGTVGEFFKNLLAISVGSNHLERIKLDDINLSKNRTASLVYNDYENADDFNFSTYREINVSEKSKVEITILFKQYEFNKELSFPFTIPRNYKTK
ncbi:MAG TPA: DUF4292 domain-containing protein [Hanamia sp.]